MNRWTRRGLLIGGIVVALPVAAIAGGKLFCAVRPPKSRVSLLQSYFPATEATDTLGAQYLEQSGSSALVSLQRLERQAHIMRAAESGCRISTMSAFEQACRDDFRAGRVHCVDGWVLSLTELDVAAVCGNG